MFCVDKEKKTNRWKIQYLDEHLNLRKRTKYGHPRNMDDIFLRPGTNAQVQKYIWNFIWTSRAPGKSLLYKRT